MSAAADSLTADELPSGGAGDTAVAPSEKSEARAPSPTSSVGCAGMLGAVKNEGVDGTWEEKEVSFQLFFGTRPEVFGSYGFYCTPQIGTYTTTDYTPALPISVVSLPLISEAEQLPPSMAAIVSKCREMNILGKQPLDFYVLIHSGLDCKPCAHLKCDNEDEFNLMMHTWVFQKDSVADSSDEITASVYMGVFETKGIRPVHTDLREGGAAFGSLSARLVILHDRRFSPDNANLQLDHSTDTPIFFSLAVDRLLKHGVVTLHVLPVGDGPSDRIRGWIRGISTFKGYLEALEKNLPDAFAPVMRAVNPLLKAEREGRSFPPALAPAASCMAAKY